MAPWHHDVPWTQHCVCWCVDTRRSSHSSPRRVSPSDPHHHHPVRFYQRFRYISPLYHITMITMITMMSMCAIGAGSVKQHNTLPRERRIPIRPRRCHQRILASTTPENESDAEAREEARLEAMESRLRSTGSSPSGTRGRFPATTDQQQKPVGQRAPWKEGQLFPEGWEEMDPIEKASELYLGERGILYWSTLMMMMMMMGPRWASRASISLHLSPSLSISLHLSPSLSIPLHPSLSLANTYAI